MARKILLADDSVTAQNMGRKILADAGYEVITVNNGSAALKKIAEQKPDLIVLDVYMPGYSGLEVCQRLKEAPETARVPVLLTVGKLEPFKPEEAKRVRADGFIVKPFEASELLAALSKMEDKIVPRAEASKPGRFARVTAAIEEGRYDKTVAIDGDSGWKDRLSFPSRKKEKTAPENGESAAIDRPIDKPTEKPHATRAEEARVDLGALAPEGLPKDVTPEEIAALAAAAAQVKGKMAESKLDEPALAAASTEAAQPSEKIEEKYAPQQANSTEAAEAASVAAASHSDLIAAISGLDTAPLPLPSASLESGFSSQALADHASTDHAPTDHGAAGQRANEPVTMALPGAGSVADTPRWTAVSMALGKEEAAISLELEMQKAYAAFAAAVNGHTSSGLAVPENSLDLAQIATDPSSAPEAGPREPAVAIPALPAPEAVQPLSGALGNASTEAIRAAVQELEMVAESFVGETAAPAEPTSAAVAEQAEVSHLAAGPTVEAVANESSTTGETQPEAAKLDLGKRDEQNSWRPEATNQEWKTQSWKSEELRAGEQQAERQKEEQKNDQWKNESPLPTAPAPSPEENHGTAAAQVDTTAPTFTNTVSAEQTSAGQSPSSREPVVAAESAAGSEPAKQESEATATTAAAWASWRRIRESGDSNPVSDEPVQKEVEQTSISQDVAAKDVAAMAVAAGAEKTPGSADSDSDPAAIASIVDSVLADLRPKIFEEISRKMGQKK